MNHLMLTAAAVALAFGLAACERESKTVERNTGTTVVQPKETVKEKETVATPAPKETVKEKETIVTTPPASGASGPSGPQGAQGSAGTSTEMKKESSSETTTKKE